MPPSSRRPIPRLQITLRLEVPDVRPPVQRWLLPRLRRLAALAGVRTGTLSLLVVGDEAMSDYHQRFSGVAGTTDVLTFDLLDSPAEPGEPIEGDLILCLDEAARQAASRGHEVRLELLLYALHGLMHLLGYDDHSPRERAAMHQAEDDLLKRAGLGAVYYTAPKKRAKSRRS